MGHMHYVRPMTVQRRVVAEVGQGIAQARRRAGLTQQALAEQTGLTRKDVSRIENGHPGVAWGKVVSVLEIIDYPLPRDAQVARPPSLEAISRALKEKENRRAG